MKLVDEELKQLIRSVLEQLVHRRYTELEHLTGGKRLTANEIRSAVSEYGRTLRMPPHLNDIDTVPIASVPGGSWSIYVPLYTEEEGRSDLTLLLRINRDRDGSWQTIIDDIRVL